MDFSKTYFNKSSLSEYPECVQKLMQSHKALCYRRHKEMQEKRMIIALPWRDKLSIYNKEIRINNVDPFYDHIIFTNPTTVATLLEKAKGWPPVEQYISSVDPTKMLSSPRGLHIQAIEDHGVTIQTCLSSWFGPEETYWLI